MTPPDQSEPPPRTADGPANEADIDAGADPSRRPTARDRIEDLRIRGLDVKDQAEVRLDDAVGRFWPVALLVEAVKRWLSTNASILAGHLAFRFFLFLVPSAVVAVSLLGLAASTNPSSIDDTTQGSLRLGGTLSKAVASAGAQTSNSHVQLGLVGLFGLLLAGLSLVTALRSVFAAVWGVPPKTNKRSKLLTLAELIVLVVIFFAANALRSRLEDEGVLFTAFGILAMLAVSCLFIGALSSMLPRRGTRVSDVIPSAIVGGLGLTLLNTAAAWYFTGKLESQSQTYGAIGVTVTLLTYLFVWGEVLVLSAVTGAVWYDRDLILAGEEPPESRGGPAGATAGP